MLGFFNHRDMSGHLKRVRQSGDLVVPGTSGGGGDSESTGFLIYKCTAVETSNSSWTGYLYDPVTGLASTPTSLSYGTTCPPRVGNYYTANAGILCNIYIGNGLVFYAPLHEDMACAETGQVFSKSGDVAFTTVQGVPCAVFNGSSYLTYSAAGFPSGNESVTLSCLFNPAAGNGDTNVLAYGSLSTNQCVSISEYPADNFYAGFYANDMNCDFSLTRGQWYHGLITFDSTSGIHAAYINGVMCKSRTTSKNTSLEGGSIGGDGRGGRKFTGKIAECKIWNYALTQAQITEEYNRLAALIQECSHNWTVTSSDDDWVYYTCSLCGATKKEVQEWVTL